MKQIERPGMAKPAQRVTIRDVAERAGVSVGTASRIINNVPNVKPAIRERVEAAIKALGYRPDMLAQSMRRGQSYMVGVLVRDMTSPVLAGFVRDSQDVLNQAGYTMMLACSYGRKDRELAFLDSIERRRVDGLIMITCSEDEETQQRLGRLGLPTVLFDRELPLSFDAIQIAHDFGIHDAMKSLHALGHQRIALITGPTCVYPSRARVEGYRRYAQAHGLECDASLLRTESFTEDSTFIEISSLLSSPRPPTALILGGISMLASALRAIHAKGLRIPEDISLVGSGDSDLAMLTSPPVSVVRWDYEQMGRTGAQLLLDRLKVPPPHAPRRIRLTAEYLQRGSCAPPRGAAAATS